MAQAVITRTADETVIRIKGAVSEKVLEFLRLAVELAEDSAHDLPSQNKKIPNVFAPLKPGAELVDDEEVDQVVQDISREIKASAWSKLKHRYLPDEPTGS